MIVIPSILVEVENTDVWEDILSHIADRRVGSLSSKERDKSGLGEVEGPGRAVTSLCPRTSCHLWNHLVACFVLFSMRVL